MRGLKILVIVMGVMLVGGTMLLVAAIATRVSQSRQPFTASPIDLPAGARIESLSAGADRLVLDVALADGTRQLLVIDLATGRRLGTIPLRQAP